MAALAEQCFPRSIKTIHKFVTAIGARLQGAKKDTAAGFTIESIFKIQRQILYLYFLMNNDHSSSKLERAKLFPRKALTVLFRTPSTSRRDVAPFGKP